MAEEVKSKPGVKVWSRIAMCFSSVWIAVLSILLGLGHIELTMTEIIESAVAIVAIWTPGFISIWAEKIMEIKFGPNTTQSKTEGGEK